MLSMGKATRFAVLTRIVLQIVLTQFGLLLLYSVGRDPSISQRTSASCLGFETNYDIVRSTPIRSYRLLSLLLSKGVIVGDEV